MKFPQEEQEVHEASQCIVAERRRNIAADALLVNEEVVCDWCQQKVKKRKLLDHQEEECPERERPCPNAVNGCKEWVPVGKFDEHIRTDCIVTVERNTLAARAREKNSPVTCLECGVVVRLRYLDRHFRDECVSRVVPCKNAAHGCTARLRWRDRHLHEDFVSLSKDRSMIQFKTGGNAFILVNSSKSQTPSQLSWDLPPPWTAEYYVWMVDAEEEILSLHKRSLELMETVAINTRENAQWQAKSDACKKKLKELKQKRKWKATDKTQGAHLSGEEMSSIAKELAEDFNDAENGLLSTRKEIALARGWIEINITEAKRILDVDVTDAESKQALLTAIADQTAQVLQERMLLVQLLPEADRALLSDLEAWSKQLTSGSPTKEDKAERQRKAAEQNKLLKKRSEFQAQLEALDPDDADSARLQRRYEREIAKVDAKLAQVSENKPTQLLERCGHHIIASSAKNVISLVAGPSGEIMFYRPSGAKAARDVNFHVRLERNRWNHVVFAAGAKELSLFLNGELKNIRRGVFDLPLSRIGSKETTESFQGYIQEIRYWNECRSAQQIQQHSASILHVSKCKSLIGYWTFEEGMGDLVDDMSLTLPRSACFDTAWVLPDVLRGEPEAQAAGAASARPRAGHGAVSPALRAGGGVPAPRAPPPRGVRAPRGGLPRGRLWTALPLQRRGRAPAQCVRAPPLPRRAGAALLRQARAGGVHPQLRRAGAAALHSAALPHAVREPPGHVSVGGLRRDHHGQDAGAAPGARVPQRDQGDAQPHGGAGETATATATAATTARQKHTSRLINPAIGRGVLQLC
ncbi:unnamed protein product [Phytophthora lilii]|uniref:Unnamed protein product n=1 Tax=Phytophthora lilii TaxID=2077276 RepID=A0A9W6T9R7_9STRA|nr:unnamed protein product [Phytophthora lilii]